MRCAVCGKGPMDGVTVYRVNEKGVKGVWACREHRLNPSTIQEIVDVLESGQPRSKEGA